MPYLEGRVSQVVLVAKNLSSNAGDTRDAGSVPWRRAWQPIPAFLPGESPWTEEPGGLYSMGLQESDMTKRLNHHHQPFGLF